MDPRTDPADRRSTKRVVHDGGEDRVAVEEPMEIRAGGEAIAVTMRTPGHDEELALGFLYGEGLLEGPAPAGPSRDFEANVVEVRAELARPAPRRRFAMTSACGVCGRASLEEVAVHAPEAGPGPRVRRDLVAALPGRLRQPGFEATGGLHATGLFDADGTLLVAREDVGRHNAMDKVIGWALREEILPLAGRLLCVSGRLGFELVQKAAVAGSPVLVGVGAPTSLAISLAADRQMTLCGFARDGRVNVYTRPDRVVGGDVAG